MTNIEKIRQEIERRIGAMYNFSEGYSALNTCRELLDFIDKLPKETPNIDLIQKSWYRQGYIDGINKQVPQWILENLKYKENPKYGQPLETVTDCHQLEEAAEKFARSYDQGTCDGIAQDCFKAGANWQKEQMKEEAIERTVKEDAGGYPYIDETELYDYDKDEPTAKKGDKVKVYIFKEK